MGRGIIQRSMSADGMCHVRKNEDKPTMTGKAKKREDRMAAEYEICRECTKEKCSGSRACMERRRRELEKEKEEEG